MTFRFTRKFPRPSSADAAAWHVRLHRSSRTPAGNAALKEWLARHPEHREAFEVGHDLEKKLATLRIAHTAHIEGRPTRKVRTISTRFALIAAALIAVTFGASHLLSLGSKPSSRLSTETGEQLTRTLSDGTRITLNTQTRLQVRFDEHTRRVDLVRGEALFDVAKNPRRPFVVYAGGRSVTALGTQFVVRYDERQTVVTLMEGKVSVAPINAAQAAGRATESPTVLRPGERVIYAEEKLPQLDRPAIERVVAWQRGQVAFSKTPLAEAIAEMNRYSDRMLELGDAELASLKVSGLFKVSDSENFALALATAYPIQLRERNGKIILLRESDGRIGNY